jgi:outer membrane receptor protein involved in Fe transport
MMPKKMWYAYAMMSGCMATLPLFAQRTPAVATAPANISHHSSRAAEVLLTRPVTVDVTNVPLARALDVIAMRAKVLVQYQMETIAPYVTPVTVHAKGMPLRAVLAQILAGTGLHAVSDGDAQLAIVARDMRTNPSIVEGGVIVGTVVYAGSRRPVEKATVLLDDTGRGVITDTEGRFRLSGVTPGTHRVTTRLLGYSRQAKMVTVVDAQTTQVEFVLETSTNTLEQVIVTGTVIPTQLKAVPNAITVITAKQLEERGITRIEQLFRGDVPGLFALNTTSDTPLDEVMMFSRGGTALSSISAGTVDRTNPIKTYVDGVELADAKYLSQIDPKSIERIEILTGPQASTIYGSNALNGVMQIFTKRGSTTRPQFTLNLMSGWVENNFSDAHAPQHDYSAQLSGVEGHLSYNVGGAWYYLGRWTPARQTARRSGFGGSRIEFTTGIGRVSADMSLRRSTTQNVRRGKADQTTTGYQDEGWYNFTSATRGLWSPETRVLNGQTLGMAIGYAPVDWWSHEIVLGQDADHVDYRITDRLFANYNDTTLLMTETRTERRSLRYSMTSRIPIGTAIQATVTVGSDMWQSLTSLWQVRPQVLTGNLIGSMGASRQPSHNAGGFLQGQLGVRERLFLTYGLRAEWNPTFGEEAQPNLAPRFGAAYTQDFGSVTAKLRASYGRSTRPPAAIAKLPSAGTDREVIAAYGPYNERIANPNLGPEFQQGGEGGVELYFGQRASFVVTRYNQTTDRLIANVIGVDSMLSLQPNPVMYGLSCALWMVNSGPTFCSSQDAAGYGYAWLSQYANVAAIRNQGWELQGGFNAGPFNTRGTYTMTKSRSLGVTEKYRPFFTRFRNFQPGAVFQYLPEHTWALGITYARGGTTLAVNTTGVGQLRNGANEFFGRNLSLDVRLPVNQWIAGTQAYNSYINMSPGYVLADVSATQRLGRRADGVLQIQNVADYYRTDYNATSASMGRQVRVGTRVRF